MCAFLRLLEYRLLNGKWEFACRPLSVVFGTFKVVSPACGGLRRHLYLPLMNRLIECDGAGRGGAEEQDDPSHLSRGLLSSHTKHLIHLQHENPIVLSNTSEAWNRNAQPGALWLSPWLVLSGGPPPAAHSEDVMGRG